MNNFNLQSGFAKYINGLIEEKHATGYKYKKGASMLARLDTFVSANFPEEKLLNKDIVIAWTNKSKNEKASTQAGRISIIRGLANYMNRMGKASYVYPPQYNSINRYNYVPYIFTKEEISKIIIASDNYNINPNSPYLHLMIPAIIRLLYGCGLRISEVLNLRVCDVNFENNMLQIYETKFNKERFIPMAKSLSEYLMSYLNLVLVKAKSDDWFFPSPYNDKHYNSSTVYQHFRKLLRTAGITHTGKGPRLQDFRHTFSVHCLKKWVLEKRDLNNCLPYLSIYLGHQDLRGTQHYLRLTADMYPTIIEKLELECSSVIPEVRLNETD
jgi:integrase